MRSVHRAVNLADIREVARHKLPKAIFDIIDGGIGDDVTVSGNRASLDAIRLRPRALADVTTVDLRTTVLGSRLDMPFLLGPCSFSRVCNPQAEKAMARAAEAAGTAYMVPGGAGEQPDAIAGAAPGLVDAGTLWYQIYLDPDRDVNAAQLDRIERAGYRALCVSIDTPTKPYREADLRNRMTLPVTITPKLLMTGLSRPRWARDFVIGNTSSGFGLTAARDAYASFSTAMARLRPVTRSEIEWLRSSWDGPLVVKGVLREEDVDLLVDLGVDAIVVSNHGGRNLDTTVPTIEALPAIVEAVDDRMEVLFDSGVRRGTDVVKALAIGAKAVLIGRPYMFGLAAAGQAGVERVVSMLRDEVERAMAFVGAASIAEIDGSLIAMPDFPRTAVPHRSARKVTA